MYKVFQDYVHRLSDGAFIPKNQGNSDYQMYLQWVANGNVPDKEPDPTDEDILNAAKQKQSDSIRVACSSQILNGFDSSALGALHHYPSNVSDQQNLAASVLDSLLLDLPSDWTTPFWCSDASGNWAFRLHTASQIQQVGKEGKQSVLAAMSKNAKLQENIRKASTMDEVLSVKW